MNQIGPSPKPVASRTLARQFFSRFNSHKACSEKNKAAKHECVGEKINTTMPEYLRMTTCLMVGLLSKVFLKMACTKVHLRNFGVLLKQVEFRAKGRSLITVLNHASMLDDPLLWGTLPNRFLAKPNLVRWSLAAKEVIFLNPIFNAFFAAGQTIPVIRGAGIYQPAIDAAIELLNQNKWVSIYPEGKVNRDTSLLPFKWGIGRLIQETTSTPIILPIYHAGMVDICPGTFPRIGKELVVSVGCPMDIRAWLKNDTNFQTIDPKDSDKARSYITGVIRSQLDSLKEETLSWMQTKGINPNFHPNL